MSTIAQEGAMALGDWAVGFPEARDPIWRSNADYDPEWTGHRRGGSGNTDELGNAVYLVYGKPNEQADMIAGWDRFFDQSERDFQRNEQGSVIYSTWHVLPVLIVYVWATRNGQPGLAARAERWLANWFALCRLLEARVSNGRLYVPICGERSCGVPPANWYGQHAIWAEARGEDWSGRREAIGALEQYKATGTAPEYTDPNNEWCGWVVAAFSEEIRRIAAPFLSCSFDEVLRLSPKFSSRVPQYVYRTDSGVIFWWGWEGEPGRDATCNGNTGPVMVCKVENREIETGPPEGGVYFRQRPSTANAWLDATAGAVLWSWLEIEARGEIRLPVGEPRAFVKIANGQWTNLLASPDDVPAPGPGAPPNPAPTPSGDGAPGGAPVEPLAYHQATHLLVDELMPLLDEIAGKLPAASAAFLSAELRRGADKIVRPPAPPKKKRWGWW